MFMRHTLVKGILWTFLSLVALVVLAAGAVYVPFVQDWVKSLAVRQVAASTGMTVEAGHLRLKFPLRLEADSVVVLTADADTMLAAASVRASVDLLPLLRSRLHTPGIEAKGLFYQMGTPDSALWLIADVGNAVFGGASVDLGRHSIELSTATVNGAKVKLLMRTDSTKQQRTDTAQTAPWLIQAQQISLRNVDYSMQMLPAIDSLGCHVGEALLAGAAIDMARHDISAKSLAIDSASAAYITPTEPFGSSPAETTDTQSVSEPWNIHVDRIRLSANDALYGRRGATPQEGFSPDWISASGIVVEIDSLFNRGAEISVPLKRLSAANACGLSLLADGKFAMASGVMSLDDFHLNTLQSSISANASMALDMKGQVCVDASGHLSLSDGAVFVPALKPIAKYVPGRKEIVVGVDIDGLMSDMNVNDISIQIPSLAKLHANGHISNPLEAASMAGWLRLQGHASGLNSLRPILPPSLGKMLNIPSLSLNGRVDYRPNSATGTLTATTAEGKLAMDAGWNGRIDGYDGSIRFTDFPVDAFLPTLGVGTLTSTVEIKGKGYNMLSPATTVDAAIHVTHIIYNTKPYDNISLTANITDGKAHGELASQNPDAMFRLGFDASLTPDSVTWALDGSIPRLDFQALGMSQEPLNVAMRVASEGRYSLPSGQIGASASVKNLDLTLGKNTLMTDAVNASLITGAEGVDASLTNGDLELRLHSPMQFDSIMAKMSAVPGLISAQIADRQIDVDSIQKAVPALDLILSMRQRNIVSDYLRQSQSVAFGSFVAGIHNDSLLRINATLLSLRQKEMRIDTIQVDALQHGKYLVYTLSMANKPGTLDEWAHVSLNGFVGRDRLSAFMRQNNIKGEKGFNLGLSAIMTDSVVTVKLVPRKPTIAYKPWTLNDDNFVSYNLYDRHIDANLAMESSHSYLKLFTEHDSLTHGDGKQEDIILQLSKIHLQDWLSVSPFAPPVKGDVNADMRFGWDTKALTGKGAIGIDDLYYGRERVGSFDLDVNVGAEASGVLRADLALMVDSVKTITASGVLNDSTLSNPFLLDFSMIHFPLSVANPFLPPRTAVLAGALNGTMEITGTMTEPQFNGYVEFDSAAVKIPMLGSTLRFTDERIPVDSNVVKFDSYSIWAANKNPLNVSGTVDLRRISEPLIDLRLKADGLQAVNSSRPKGADIYGKAFFDIDATVSGSLSDLDVNAKVALLTGSDVTYVMSDAQQTLSSHKQGDLVTFVEFNDTLQMASADSITTSPFSLNVDAELTIEPGTTITVDLSTDGKNRVQLNTTADLDYTLTSLNGDRLTGSVNLLGGFVRYTPPFMSEKRFEFNEGSYVAFNGNMLNPVLNIKATDILKANVTQEGQNSRLVNFDVLLSITGTLDNMDVAFDLSTSDDITVQNELTSMSASQRANQAMNLLLYNVYTGAGTKGSANLAGNPLYSFLTSQINSWAANNIRGVDLTFGIDQYDKTVGGNTQTATSYSYRVSKSLFDDRFKIVIGGNYSTDADADENFSQNLINDISFEYLLNRNGSMLVKIFRHTGYESILEGEVTQTGVGFVVKRKLNTLRNLFNFGHKTKPEAIKKEEHDDEVSE